MEELYEIMRDLLELEYDQQSLLHILNMLEHTYSKTQKRKPPWFPTPLDII